LGTDKSSYAPEEEHEGERHRTSARSVNPPDRVVARVNVAADTGLHRGPRLRVRRSEASRHRVIGSRSELIEPRRVEHLASESKYIGGRPPPGLCLRHAPHL